MSQETVCIHCGVEAENHGSQKHSFFGAPRRQCFHGINGGFYCYECKERVPTLLT